MKKIQVDNSKVLYVVVIFIIAIVAIFISLYFLNMGEGTGGGNNTENHTNTNKTVVLSVAEYIDDGNYEINHTTHEFYNDYLSLEPGDTLVIRDKIFQKPKYRGYVDWVGTDITTISIGGSNDTWPIVIYVKGNVTKNYNIQDTVEIILHINYYDIHQEWNNETWHIYGEFPEESINNEGKYSGGYILIPENQIRKV